MKETRRRDPRVLAGEIEVSEYAVNCTRCGLVLLSSEEGWSLEDSHTNEFNCPLCDGTARADVGAALVWNTEVKKIIWADLLH
jgi:hypothetical protein